MTQADLTRERLVRAALELFTARGYHETTTPQIAKQAGVAEGTIYRHFTSKQHCFNELFRTAARWASQLIKDVDALKVGPREKLAELSRGLVTGAAQEAALARLFFIQRHEDLLDEESRKTARDFRLSLESLIAQGKADGSVKAGAAEVWAGVWLGVVTHVIDRVSAKEWPETHPGVKLALDGAWGGRVPRSGTMGQKHPKRVRLRGTQGRVHIGLLRIVRGPVVRVVDTQEGEHRPVPLDHVAAVLHEHLARIATALDDVTLA